jgi:hypothetical protein
MDHYERDLAAIRAELERGEYESDLERARTFLRVLDPESAEGEWFEAIAAGFPSRLDAALAYVRQVTSGSKPLLATG